MRLTSRKMQRTPHESFRVQVDNGQEPGEQALSQELEWNRSADDWVLGSGTAILR